MVCKHCHAQVNKIETEADERGFHDPHFTGECLAYVNICMGCLHRTDECQCGRFSE